MYGRWLLGLLDATMFFSPIVSHWFVFVCCATGVGWLSSGIVVLLIVNAPFSVVLGGLDGIMFPNAYDL